MINLRKIFLLPPGEPGKKFGVMRYGRVYCFSCMRGNRLYRPDSGPESLSKTQPCTKCGIPVLVAQWRPDAPDYLVVPARRVETTIPAPVRGWDSILPLLRGQGRTSDARSFVGVEIEFASTSTENEAQLVATANRLLPYVSLVHDGSVSPRAMSVSECRVFGSISTGSLRRRIETMMRAIKDAGGAVNRSTGIHVHLNAMCLSPAQKAIMARRLIKALPALALIVPESRFGNIYCHWDVRGRSHYNAVNAHTDHGTIEVRVHAGSLNPEKIQAFASILALIAHGTARMPKYFGETAMLDYLRKVSRPDLAAWYISRREALGASTACHMWGKTEAPSPSPRALASPSMPFILTDTIPVTAGE